MAKRGAIAKAVEEITQALPYLLRLPAGKAWIDYDEEADVLYVSFKRPQKATDTELLEDQGIMLRYRNKELVGVTVSDSSKRRNGDKKRVVGTGSAREQGATYDRATPARTQRSPRRSG